MAMSETMPSPTDWVQFYQQNLAGFPQNSPSTTAFHGGGRVSDAMIVTTTTSTPTPVNIMDRDQHLTSRLSPEGRVSKPIRRRSRASRRTPTTVFNTDTSNFRAMVQQFTGGHADTFPSQGSSQFSSGIVSGYRNNIPQQIVNPNNDPGAYRIQLQQQQVQQNVPYMFRSLSTSHPPPPIHVSSSIPNMDVSDQDRIQIQRGSSSSSNNEEKTENNFML